MTQDVQAFEDFMVLHAARINDVAQRFTRGMPPGDKNAIMLSALRIAQERAADFDPQCNRGLVLWFTACMETAAHERPAWAVFRSGCWQWLSAKHLEDKFT